MNLERLKQAAHAAGGGWLPAAGAQAAMADSGMPLERLMLELLPLASAFSIAPLSGFRVGAVAQAASGALYFGANLEFAGGPLNWTVHAEQSAVVNALIHERSAPVRLAVSAAPCGYCRQFLFELAGGAQLEILLAGRPPAALATLLPGAFGPAELGVPGGMPASALHSLECLLPQESAAAAAAWEAARAAYAPYTGALAGAALRTRSGRVFAGPYLENAAFNPSLSPMQTAIVAALLGGESGTGVTEAALVRVEPSRVDHAGAARLLLDRFAPGVPLREIFIPALHNAVKTRV